MSLYKNHEFYYLQVKISFLIYSNFCYYILRPMKRNFDAYKLTVIKNLLVLHLKISAKKDILLIDI